MDLFAVLVALAAVLHSAHGVTVPEPMFLYPTVLGTEPRPTNGSGNQTQAVLGVSSLFFFDPTVTIAYVDAAREAANCTLGVAVSIETGGADFPASASGSLVFADDFVCDVLPAGYVNTSAAGVIDNVHLTNPGAACSAVGSLSADVDGDDGSSTAASFHVELAAPLTMVPVEFNTRTVSLASGNAMRLLRFEPFNDADVYRFADGNSLALCMRDGDDDSGTLVRDGWNSDVAELGIVDLLPDTLAVRALSDEAPAAVDRVTPTAAWTRQSLTQQTFLAHGGPVIPSLVLCAPGCAVNECGGVAAEANSGLVSGPSSSDPGVFSVCATFHGVGDLVEVLPSAVSLHNAPHDLYPRAGPIGSSYDVTVIDANDEPVDAGLALAIVPGDSAADCLDSAAFLTPSLNSSVATGAGGTVAVDADVVGSHTALVFCIWPSTAPVTVDDLDAGLVRAVFHRRVADVTATFPATVLFFENDDAPEQTVLLLQGTDSTGDRIYLGAGCASSTPSEIASMSPLVLLSRVDGETRVVIDGSTGGRPTAAAPNTDICWAPWDTFQSGTPSRIWKVGSLAGVSSARFTSISRDTITQQVEYGDVTITGTFNVDSSIRVVYGDDCATDNSTYVLATAFVGDFTAAGWTLTNDLVVRQAPWSDGEMLLCARWTASSVAYDAGATPLRLTVERNTAFECGDGVRNSLYEECDDGNNVDGDGCSAYCQTACGDGVRVASETCDDGNAFSGDGCSSQCRVEFGYTCNTVPEGTGPSDCSQCRDGVVGGTEECDDGNSVNSDGCDTSCRVETDFVCVGAPSVCVKPLCGNGLVDSGTGEADDDGCDDGNLESGDGCSALCTVEAGFDCTHAVGAESTCAMQPRCGDGLVTTGLFVTEECDDGNFASFDGCSSCEIVAGWECRGEPSDCRQCGNGVQDGREQCDDGNAVSGDGCDSWCNEEPLYSCFDFGRPCELRECGDGIIFDEWEACDDGNTHVGDGCGQDCQVEAGWTCPRTVTTTTGWSHGGQCSLCGNGIVEAGESCDDGNPYSGDGCYLCTVESGYQCNFVGCSRIVNNHGFEHRNGLPVGAIIGIAAAGVFIVLFLSCVITRTIRRSQRALAQQRMATQQFKTSHETQAKEYEMTTMSSYGGGGGGGGDNIYDSLGINSMMQQQMAQVRYQQQMAQPVAQQPAKPSWEPSSTGFTFSSGAPAAASSWQPRDARGAAASSSSASEASVGEAEFRHGVRKGKKGAKRGRPSFV